MPKHSHSTTTPTPTLPLPPNYHPHPCTQLQILGHEGPAPATRAEADQLIDSLKAAGGGRGQQGKRQPLSPDDPPSKGQLDLLGMLNYEVRAGLWSERAFACGARLRAWKCMHAFVHAKETAGK